MPFFIFISMFLTACGTDFNDYVHGFSQFRMPTDERLLPFVKDFERDFDRKVTMPVVFSNEGMGDGDSATCFKYTNELWMVRIKIKHKKASKAELKAIVYHELAHCELGRQHDFRLVLTEDKISVLRFEKEGIEIVRKQYIPNSIMWPSVVEVTGINGGEFKPHYIEEIRFQGRIPENAVEVHDFPNAVEARRKMHQYSERPLVKLWEETEEESCVKELILD